jgi:hypothetical protein
MRNTYLLLCGFSFLVFKSFAQTSGPSQPEVQSFQPVTMTDMVDPSSGEFRHQIPLFTIGGYPVNINYNSQVTMEQEASMVGLGWNLNVGAITRQVRGLPDDFKGDLVKRQINMKPNITIGLKAGMAWEIIGFDKEKLKNKLDSLGVGANISSGLFYNNYNGWGIESSVGIGLHGNIGGLSGNAGIGINSNSQHGTSVNPYAGISYSINSTFKKLQKDERMRDGIKKKKPISSNFKIAGANYDFNRVSYTPLIELPFRTFTTDFTVKGGAAAFFTEFGGEINGYLQKQKLIKNNLENPAYGFIYADDGKNNDDALMDFNREADGVMTEDKPNLPMAYATQDIFSVVAQGLGGVFEIKRNNVFVGFDPTMKNITNDVGGELDFGQATGTHTGAELRYGRVVNNTGKWSNNYLLPEIDFISPSGSVSEKTYFKNPSDVMFNRQLAYEYAQIEPISPLLSNFPFPPKLLVGNNLKTFVASDLVNNLRDKRLDVINTLTAVEAEKAGIQKTIPSYKLNDFLSLPTFLSRKDDVKKEHHLSELTCLKPDGSTYVFNLPAYNKSKREVAYSIKDGQISSDYTTNRLTNEASNPGGGKDEFISVTETPAYAHSYLLGMVLSPNYMDVDDNGPTDNDLGDFVKFNYGRVYENYQWSSINDIGKASATKGRLADEYDAKANYVEGTKEVFYIHSIESKNEVSRFYYSDRQDAHNLSNPSEKLKKVDSIIVFSKAELLKNTSNPYPIKRIYFKYDYSLCQGIPMNTNSVQAQRGKLTLKQVYFKEGASNKGKHTPYEFTYSSVNPTYNSLETDRWGNFKPNTNYGDLDNQEFPYAIQDRIQANQNASAWLLSKIKLPSKGEITIDYEAHDYAFVQDKKAMFMTPIIGFSKEEPTNFNNMNNNLYQIDGLGWAENNYIVFKLKEPINGNLSAVEIKQRVKDAYFSDPTDTKYGSIINNPHTNLFAKFRVKIGGTLNDAQEEISAFVNPQDCGGIKVGSAYTHGWIKLEHDWIDDTPTFNGEKVNPLAKVAWQFVKQQYPQVLFGFDDEPALNGEEAVETIANILIPQLNILRNIANTNPYKQLRGLNVAQEVDLQKSYIRLYEPTGFKLGGNGARVKQINITDNWLNMTDNATPNGNYSIRYDYNKNEGGKTMSAGVMAYEPDLGADENPWKQPIFFKEKNKLMPDNNEFLVGPIGESLFPNASIVYSQVKTTQNPINNPTQEGTGYTLNEFYTAKDFPTKVANTAIATQRKPKFSMQFMNIVSEDYMISEQGYQVITNDMHGKPKREIIAGEEGNIIQEKKYVYKTNGSDLANQVAALNEDGQVQQNQLLGLETQVYGDARYFNTKSFSTSAHFNLDLQLPWALIPTSFPDIAFENKDFSSFTLTKHIRQQGILDSVVVTDKGSTIATKNLLWDAKTGAVLLTQTTNEFKDPIYNFTYPAHLTYKGMGMACENIGTEVLINPTSQITPTFIQLPGEHNYFEVGDIVFMEKLGGTGGVKLVVESVSLQNNATKLTFRTLYRSNLSINGQYAGGKLKIIQSGKRNVATTPIGSLVLLKNPIVNNRLEINTQKQIIDANAVVFDNKTKDIVCDTCSYGPKPAFRQVLSSVKNLGAWQPVATYKFVDDRTQTSTSPVLRTDGAISNFVPFWNRVNNGRWLGFTNQGATNYNLWIAPEKVTMVDAESQPLESKNAIGIYSSVSFSNFDGMVNATTANARYHEMLFDGFEDYMTCPDDNHYTVLSSQYPTFRSSEQAHTGNYSMKTGANDFTKNLKNINAQYDCEKEVEVVEGQFNQEIQLASRPPSEKCDCEPDFQLQPNKEYILSLWVRESNASSNAIDYQSANVKITTGSGNTATSITARPEGQILDGWQRIEKHFTTPATSNQIKLTFSPSTYFDDVRIHPADANMKSYVYDERDYSLMATLDENNFATFYEYNNEKNLKRVKKETEKSVVTLQEVNFGAAKK